MWNRVEIKQQAKEALRNNYGFALGMTVLTSVLLGLLSACSVGVAALILGGPVTMAGTWAMLTTFRGTPCGVPGAYTQGFDNVGRKIGGYLWMQLWIFLWSMVLVIPGIVKSFSYAMTPYILVDLPQVEAKEALRLSMRMMQGHKAELLMLQLSFLGWALLGALTFGLVTLLYVNPYLQLAQAGFYQSVKQDAIQRGILVPAALG